jgi:hypothetical protein
MRALLRARGITKVTKRAGFVARIICRTRMLYDHRKAGEPSELNDPFVSPFLVVVEDVPSARASSV